MKTKNKKLLATMNDAITVMDTLGYSKKDLESVECSDICCMLIKTIGEKTQWRN